MRRRSWFLAVCFLLLVSCVPPAQKRDGAGGAGPGSGFGMAALGLVNLILSPVQIAAGLLEGIASVPYLISQNVQTINQGMINANAKVTLDDNALYRHPDLEAQRDKDEEDPADVEAQELDLNYVKLDGNVGCMVNGAGLAMATMDLIKLSGGEPANFLDVGGTADAQRVENAMRFILKDPNVKAILINIFGGIVRCDRVAQGVVDAYQAIGDIPVPVIVRLQGTNADIAKKIIDESGLKVMGATEFQEAADLVSKVLAQ